MADPVPTAGAAALRIRLIGDLQVRRADGKPVTLPASRRTRALLGYLVATATRQSRSALCDLLWDGPDDPRASLRWSLTKLRPVVDDGAVQRLVADREHVAFEAQACSVDLVRVAQLLEGGVGAATLARLEEAAALLQGEFLDGLDLPACYRFHHWCMAERERHGTLRRAVLEALVERLAGEPARALPYGHAMVAADPLAESAHANLLRLLAADGRYPEAERQYDWARELLRREVALAPGGALDDAIHQVRRTQRTAGAKPAPAAERGGESAAPIDGSADLAGGAVLAAAFASISGRAAEAPPIVGRAAECALIDAVLAGPPASPVLLLFVGEPGIGKTRLLDRLAECATRTGRQLIRGRCFEAEMARPYGLWLDALRALPTNGLDAGTLEQAAPLLAGRAADDGGNRERMFAAAAALVLRLAALRPLALVVDDLQWIDEGSAALLHYVMRSLDASAPVVVVGAARAGELEDNAWAKALLQSLARASSVRRHALAPLADAEARRLIEAAPLDAADAARRAGGNPLYLLELARAAHQGGDPAANNSLSALINTRLQALDAPARDLLGWAAAIGGELRPELLAAAAGLPLAKVLARLDRFEQRGLLAATTQGRFDFAHDVVRQVVYRKLSQPRRRSIHQQCARALAAAAEDDPWLHAEVVRHAALADDSPGTVRACVAAATHCLRMFANGQAGEVADQGLARIGTLAPGAERVALEIALLRLRVAAAAGPGGRRLPALAERIEQAVGAAEALGLHAQASAAWEILSFCHQQAGDPPQALTASLAAQHLARRADAATHCRQLANSGRCLLDIEADPLRGRALLAEAAALATELDLKVMEIEWGEGLVARAEGDLARASKALSRAVELARLTDNHWREFECMVWLATVELEAGRHADVLRHVNAIVAAAGRMGGDMQAPFAQALAALARMHRGDSSGEAELVQAIAALRELDDKAHLAYALNEAAAFAFAEGRVDTAEAQASEALAAAEAVRRPTEAAVAAAQLALASRDADSAAAWLARAPADAAPSARAASAVAQARQAIAALPTHVPTQQPQAADSITHRRSPCPVSSSNAVSTRRRPTRT